MVMIKITIKIAKIIKLFVICYYLSCHGRVFSTTKKILLFTKNQNGKMFSNCIDGVVGPKKKKKETYKQN